MKVEAATIPRGNDSTLAYADAGQSVRLTPAALAPVFQ